MFVANNVLTAEPARITGDTAKRLLRVLRLEVGDTFLALDDLQQEHTCRIIEATNKTVDIVVEGSRPITSEPRLSLTVAQAIPKGGRLELVIQKCTELGAAAIIPLITDRGVVRPNADEDLEEALEERLRRWQLVARHAAEQSGRAKIPEVHPPRELGTVLSMSADCDRIFILDEREQQTSLPFALQAALGTSSFGLVNASSAGLGDSSSAGILPALTPPINRIMLLIAPEGGFTDSEIDRAHTYGAISVSLGPRILRTETAGIVATAIIMALCGEMEPFSRGADAR